MADEFCTACGSARTEGAQFCTKCGARFENGPPVAPQYVQPDAYVHPAAAPRKKSKWVKVILFSMLAAGLVFAIGMGVLVWIVMSGAGECASGTGNSVTVDNAGISADQLRITEEFGLPQVFTVVIGEDIIDAAEGGDLDAHRVEFWDYPEMGARIVFRDGAVVGTRDIEVLPDAFAYPEISPLSFAEGMSPGEVSSLIGIEPGGSAQITPEIAQGLEVLVWDGVLSCTFENGGLVAAETAPVMGEVAQ
ncbi:MAG: hypothetical protein JXE06_05990 [Coriobacteriia bacterium]|nr:hypothetical protein [Coriobacteriia bacterium]MBN2821671.1 hypothetical protein [Coriobacteriia bacterium]